MKENVVLVKPDADLQEFLETAVTLGFVLLETCALERTQEDADRVLQCARNVCKRAQELAEQIPADAFPELRVRLRELGDALIAAK